MDQQLFFLGGDSQGGTYVLRIVVHRRLVISFGGFDRGTPIVIEPGEYLYVGSALAVKGASSLGRRTVRHATRTGNGRPHGIRELMLAKFSEVGLGIGDLRLRNGKHLKWNVDHLLDSPCVDLVAAYLIRSPRPLEQAVGEMLQKDDATVVFAPGLGANDFENLTLLLRVEGGEDWWQRLPAKLRRCLRAAKSSAIESLGSNR